MITLYDENIFYATRPKQTKNCGNPQVNRRNMFHFCSIRCHFFSAMRSSTLVQTQMSERSVVQNATLNNVVNVAKRFVGKSNIESSSFDWFLILVECSTRSNIMWWIPWMVGWRRSWQFRCSGTPCLGKRRWNLSISWVWHSIHFVRHQHNQSSTEEYFAFSFLCISVKPVVVSIMIARSVKDHSVRTVIHSMRVYRLIR